ncbi:hypothetical protein A2U01_0109676, partial [Trifolium medium]|nr:hypothetical protein [Trifolium medium]
MLSYTLFVGMVRSSDFGIDRSSVVGMVGSLKTGL